MADSARVDRVLAVTRQGFRAPRDARERVRAALSASGQQPGDAGGGGGHAAGGLPHLSPASAVGVARSTAALLSGLTFIAGFWLGGATSDSEPVSPSAQTSAGLPSAGAEQAPSAAPPAPPSGGSPQAESPRAVEPSASVSSTSAHGASARAGVPPPEREGPRRVLRATRSRAAVRDGRVGDGNDVAREQSARRSGEELVLLRRAEHAIRSGQPELALSLLDELEQRYPKTRLDEERMAARLMARCARGDLDASAEAARFLRSRPASVYSERVRSVCALDAMESAPDGNDAPGH